MKFIRRFVPTTMCGRVVVSILELNLAGCIDRWIQSVGSVRFMGSPNISEDWGRTPCFVVIVNPTCSCPDSSCSGSIFPDVLS